MTDIINTRSAALVSHNDFIDDTLVEESIASSLDSQKDDAMRNDDDILTGSMNVTASLAAKIDGGSNDDANQNKITRDSQEIDARAFKSQFDEISNASRLLENAKLTNFNNRYNGLVGQATLTNHLPLRRTNGDPNIPFHTHQRSNSHPHPLSFTGRQHVLQHKRSASSISGLSFNGSYSNSNPNPYYSGRNTLNSLPNTPLSFNPYEHDEYLPLRLHHQLGELNPDKTAFGEIDDDGSRLKTLRDLNNSNNNNNNNNNNRYDVDLDWDSSPTSSSTPGGLFAASITPPSNYSTRSSTPYFAQSHMLLDDDELLEKQLLLEEEQKLLSFQKQKLDNAINQLRYHNNDPNLIESKFKYLPSPPRPRPTTPSSRKQSSRNLLVPSNSQQPSTPPRFQHSNQEPIGTPLRKMSNNGFGTNPSTPITSASTPEQHSSFSLFSKSPVLSLNNVFFPRVNEYDGKASDGLHGGFPLTPAGTPPKNDESGGYFFSSHYLNPGNNYHATNSVRSQQKRDSDNHHRNGALPTPSYYPSCTPFTASQFPSQHTPNSTAGYPTRATLYSSPVDERDEDVLSWTNDAFEKLPLKYARSNVFPTNDESGWERDVKIENKLHQKFHDVPSSVMTSSNVNGFTNGLMETAAFGNHRHGFELEVV